MLPSLQKDNIRFIADNLQLRLSALRKSAQLSNDAWESLIICVRLINDIKQELDNAPSETD